MHNSKSQFVSTLILLRLLNFILQIYKCLYTHARERMHTEFAIVKGIRVPFT